MSSKLNRRKFLQRMAQIAMASALPTQFLLERVRAASSGGMRRRHFINLVGLGGWDASWHHNTFSGRHLIDQPGAHFSLSAGGFEYEKSGATYKYTSKCSSSEEHELGTHPEGARLGPAMAAAMGGSTWDRTLIWKGLEHPGNHGLNNKLIIHGNSSSYAVSTSGLISTALAQVDRRPLHYVLMADEPTDLFTNFAMAEDAAIPVCLNGITEFASLTSLHADEPTDVAVRDEIAASVRKLSLDVLAKRAKLASSQTVAKAYAASLEGASYVYGSDLSSDPEMLYLKKYYFLEALKSFTSLITVESLASKSSLVDYTGATAWKYFQVIQGIAQSLNFYSSLPSYTDFLANPTSYKAALADIERNPSLVSTPSALSASSIPSPAATWLGRLRTQAAHYAFADYLIRKNLSAVVDLRAWPSFIDAHGGSVGSYLDELISLQFTFGCFFALQRSLQSVSLPDQGGTLLDATLISLHTEFDRFAYHEAKDFVSREKVLAAGTNHANSASVLLAGYGVRGGKVVGGVHEGTNMSGTFPAQNYLDPLPMDPSSGKPSSSGRVQSVLAVSPTIAAAFGTTLPAQQLTDFSSVPAVLKAEES